MAEFNRNIIGCVIRLQTVSGDYEGTVKTVCEETGKLVLDKVSVLPEEKKLRGIQNFFRCDILSSLVLRKSEVQPKKQTTRLPEEMGSRLIKLQPLPFSHKPTRNDIHQYDGTEAEASEEDEPEEPFFKEGPIQCYSSSTNGKKVSHLRFELPATFQFIDSLDKSFEDAITCIEQHSIIGCCMEGAPLRRDGELCWLLISTRNKVYFFDLLALQDVFISCLKMIMENPSIMKVFHDCRLPSDVLFHKYGITLENVFDTLTADIANYCRKHNNCLPEFAHSLTTCLQFYLDLDHELLSCPKIRMSCMKKDLYEWKRRPLSSTYRDAGIRQVVYLRELRVAIMEELLSDVNACTRHFLSVVRDASCEEISSLSLDASHLIPPGMNKMGYRSYINSEQNAKFSNRNRLSTNDKQHSTSLKILCNNDEDNFLGDLIDTLKNETNLFSKQQNNTRRSLPAKLPNPSKLNGNVLDLKRIRSRTNPSSSSSNGSLTSENLQKKNCKTVNRSPNSARGHQHSTEIKTLKAKETLRNTYTEVVKDNNFMTVPHNKDDISDKLEFSESADVNDIDISSLGEKFAWPTICPIRRHVEQNCVPAGRII